MNGFLPTEQGLSLHLDELLSAGNNVFAAVPVSVIVISWVPSQILLELSWSSPWTITWGVSMLIGAEPTSLPITFNPPMSDKRSPPTSKLMHCPHGMEISSAWVEISPKVSFHEAHLELARSAFHWSVRKSVSSGSLAVTVKMSQNERPNKRKRVEYDSSWSFSRPQGEKETITKRRIPFWFFLIFW